MLKMYRVNLVSDDKYGYMSKSAYVFAKNKNDAIKYYRDVAFNGLAKITEAEAFEEIPICNGIILGDELTIIQSHL